MEVWIKASVTQEVWTLRLTAPAFRTRDLAYQLKAEQLYQELHWDSNEHFAARFPNFLMVPDQIERLLNISVTGFGDIQSNCVQSPTQVSLWPSNIKNSCSLHWFLPSPVQCTLSSIYSLLTLNFPLHFSEIRRGSALVWTWETAWHKITVLSVTGARSRCQRKSSVAG